MVRSNKESIYTISEISNTFLIIRKEGLRKTYFTIPKGEEGSVASIKAHLFIEWLHMKPNANEKEFQRQIEEIQEITLNIIEF